jgi:hypothetical protein
LLNQTTRHWYTPVATDDLTKGHEKEASDKFCHFYRLGLVPRAQADL